MRTKYKYYWVNKEATAMQTAITRVIIPLCLEPHIVWLMKIPTIYQEAPTPPPMHRPPDPLSRLAPARIATGPMGSARRWKVSKVNSTTPMATISPVNWKTTNRVGKPAAIPTKNNRQMGIETKPVQIRHRWNIMTISKKSWQRRSRRNLEMWWWRMLVVISNDFSTPFQSENYLRKCTNVDNIISFLQ